MKKYTKKTIQIYWRHMKRYRLMLFLLIITAILGPVANTIAPLYYKKFFDLLGSSGSQSIIYAGLIQVLIAVALIKLFHWLMWRINNFVNAYFESSIMSDLANTAFEYLHKHSFSFFNNNFGGSLVKKMNYFTRAFEDIVDKFIYNFIPLFVNLFIITVILYFKYPLLGIFILVWTAVTLAFNYFVSNYKYKLDVAKNEAQSSATGDLADTITNHSNVKLFNSYQKEVNRFGDLNDKVHRLRLRSWNIGNYFDAVQSLLVVSLEVVIMYFGVRLWQQGLFTVGDFVLLQSYVITVVNQVWMASNVLRRVYQSFADAEEMTEILEMPVEIINARNAKELVIQDGRIEFVNVSFNYQQTRKVLNNFDLKIKAHEKVAFIGPSGAGKTTVVKLLLRNHDISRGKILIDGQKISQVTMESLWQNISLVPQDPILFHRTLMENIRYGKEDATDEEVIEAAKLAHAHDFISGLSDGYNTYVGERGIKLSGGERQRVAIARAILRNAPILVLDEATSSLDSESEKLIQEALDHLMRDKTVIVIAHRLSTIRKMDRIIVIDEGSIKEVGTHKSLLAKNKGIYNKLWELQAGGY